MHILRAVPVLTSGVHKLCMALLLSIQNAVILLCDRKCRDRSGAAMSSAAANEDKPKRCSHRHKGKKKMLFTIGRPQVGRNLHQDPLTSTASP